MLTNYAMKKFRNVAVATLGLLATFAVYPTGEATAEVSGAAELSTIQGAGYSVSLAALDTKVGAPGHFLVVITAKDGYKVNTKFPHKLKLQDPPSGLTLPKTVLKKKDGSFKGDKSFTFKVPLTAKSAGNFDVKGKLKLSVCNAESCVIKKEKLRATVKAK